MERKYEKGLKWIESNGISHNGDKKARKKKKEKERKKGK